MTLRLIEGFESETNWQFRQSLSKFSSAHTPSVQTSYKRSGSNALQIPTNADYYGNYSYAYYTYVYKYFYVANSTLFVGFGIRLSIRDANQDYYMRQDDGFAQIGTTGTATILSLNNSGQIKVYNGKTGSNIGTTTNGLIATSTQNYIQVKIYAHATNGSVTIKVGNHVELDITGINNSPTSPSNQQYLQFTDYLRAQAGGCTYPPLQMYIDDIYAADDAGTDNNNFLGICSIVGNLPNSDGDSTDFTASTGNRYTCVDEASADGADYVYTDSTNKSMLFNFSDNTINTGYILGIQVSTAVIRSDTGSGMSKYVLKYRDLADSEYDTTETNVISAAGQSEILTIFEKNPISTLSQTNSDIAEMQFGQKTTRIA